MKKISFIILISIILCMLTSCGAENDAKLIDFNTITYNGATYCRADDDDWDLYYTQPLGLSNALFPSKRMQRVGITPFLSTIWAQQSQTMSNDILILYSPWTNVSCFFKEDFEMPEYNELTLDKIFIFLPLENIDVIDFSEDETVTWADIIDYEVEITHNLDNIHWVCASTKEYSDLIHTGVYYVVVIDDVAYIQVHPTYVFLFYKITDEYQDIFKEAIDKANEKE
jgi:hypothetical protein